VTDVPRSITLRMTLRPVVIAMMVRSDRSPARRSEKLWCTIVTISGTDRTGHVGGPG
jgi:hypothetical protein